MITNCANVQLKGGSLFDGIGGFPLAGTKFGINFVWASEIEAFPISVTEKHFPNMRHLGDITKINGAEIEPVDVITFGSPCQDLSVAGKRAGFKGQRSGLFMEAVRIIREMREKTNGQYPRFAVWENVPGAFSSKCGADFRAVLEEITESEIPMPSSGKWATAGMVRSNGREIAWRVLDAQYWGVPQRRKRIFLVADFRGHCAAEILFVEESLRGGVTKSCGEGQRIARSVAGSFGECVAVDHVITTGGNCTAQGPCVKVDGPMWTLKASGVHAVCQETTGSVTQSTIGADIYNLTTTGELACSLTCGGGGTASGPSLLTLAQHHTEVDNGGVVQTLSARMEQQTFVCFEPRSQDGVPRIHYEICPTLNTAQGGQRQPCTAYGIAGNTIDRKIKNGGNGKGVKEEVSYTLNTIDRHAVAFGEADLHNYKQDRISTLKASGGCLGGGSETFIAQAYRVRRLTPTECERLQGLPDGYTITDKASDTARYKALGNGMAQPCVDYVISGIAGALKTK